MPVVTHKRLLVERPMLLLVFNVGKPWLDTAGVPEKILLVDGILISLSSESHWLASVLQ